MPTLPSCTAQLKSGRFCDAPQWDGAPFPICQRHAMQAYAFVGLQIRHDRERNARAATAARISASDDPIVYYIQMGDRIKIGYTRNLVGRLAALMARPSDVLAVEPGAQDVETSRHQQFANDRIDRRHEFFRPSPRLMQHIEAMCADHGDLRARLVDKGTSVRI